MDEQEKKTIAEKLIVNFKKRNMEGFYFASVKEAKDFLYGSLLKKGAKIAYGGSMTFEKETGLCQELKASPDYVFLDRTSAKTEEEVEAMNANIINSDYFFMSSNAITKDGVLFNIDGRGNRVSFLTYGPKNVIIVAGMNKVVEDIPAAYERLRTVASPKNAVRLKRNTPCAKVGHCMDCFSPDCICSSVVITRRSHVPFRIKILLIGEDLGY